MRSTLSSIMREQLHRKMQFFENAGRVQRCHTVPTLHPQNVAAHSYGVAWWCYLLTDGAPSAALLMHALAHDTAEHVTGDMPAPTKRRLGISGAVETWEAEIMEQAGIALPPLPSVEELRILKLADCLELAQHCVRELSLGNRSRVLCDMWINIRKYAEEVANFERELELHAIELLDCEWNYYHV